ncbi:hypothetical protein [Desulfurispira natronophila]|uniref:Uncharacterized protein n=1 Tax=Desulfurispira natronophila TaxID=682562 RepID=A0A7W7Y5H2_9BACT|nr:hypothetical protein [Desulfurispira natronophila]MBB5022445.1 hypothetical protein [Desulfurispira natronophila]
MLIRWNTLAQIDQRSYIIQRKRKAPSLCQELSPGVDILPTSPTGRRIFRPVYCRLLISPHLLTTFLVRLPVLHPVKQQRALRGMLEQQAGLPDKQLLWDAFALRPSPHDSALHEYAVHYARRENINALCNELRRKWGWRVCGISTTLHGLAKQQDERNQSGVACYVLFGEETGTVGLVQDGRVILQRTVPRGECSPGQTQETMAAFHAQYRIMTQSIPIYLWDICGQHVAGAGEWSHAHAIPLSHRDSLGMSALLEHAYV